MLIMYEREDTKEVLLEKKRYLLKDYTEYVTLVATLADGYDVGESFVLSF